MPEPPSNPPAIRGELAALLHETVAAVHEKNAGRLTDGAVFELYRGIVRAHELGTEQLSEARLRLAEAEEALLAARRALRALRGRRPTDPGFHLEGPGSVAADETRVPPGYRPPHG